MNTPKPNIACILASGLSRRFGKYNKLLALINDTPMIAHVAKTVCTADFDRVFALVDNSVQLHSVLDKFTLELIINQQPEKGQSQAIKIAANKAIEVNARSLTIVLGDMPFISTDLLNGLLQNSQHYDAVVSDNGQHTSPPALLSSQHFPQLQQLCGDQGALKLLNSIDKVKRLQVPPELLNDIDTPQRLAELTC